MKKSLSAILATSMVASMFASVAFAAEAPKTAQEMFDVLKTKGIFEGINDKGDAGLDQKMNRAQVSKILVKLMGLSEDEAGAAGYKDLTVETWAKGFIGAATKAGLMEGTATAAFDPAGTFTTEQLAAVMVRALKLEQSTDKVEGKVSDWAKGYVAAAVKAGLIAKTADYSAPALREVLVTTAFAAQDKLAPVAAKVSVADVKPTGVYKVEVKLNKEVDTAVAKFTVKKGSLTVGSTATWSDDKKTATLKLDTRLSAGDYTVTLTGLDAAAVETASKNFTAQDEQVSKIDFVNANDTLPYSAAASIEVKASNQYGEAVSIGASNFTALVSGASVAMKKNDEGNFVISTNVKGFAGVTQGNGIIPVTVYFNNSAVTVTKNFKVGTVPLLTKIEAGKVTYSNNGTKLSAKDDKATIPLSLFDQYGNKLVKAQFSGSSPEILATNINPVVTPYEANLVIVKTGTNGSLDVADLFDENDNTRLEVKLLNKLDKNADFTVNIFGGSSSATATVAVGAANLATKVEFDAAAVVLAADDKDVKIPLVAFDANGTKLTAQDIADNAAANRFSFNATNGLSATVIQTGVDKGKLLITFNTPVNGVYNNVGSKVFVSGQINQSQTNTFVQTNIAVGDVRVPDRVAVTTENAPKGILGAGDKVVMKLKDQYGSDRGNIAATIPSANGQTSSYQVVVEVTYSGTGVAVTPIGAIGTPVNNVYTVPASLFAEFNKGFNFTSTAGVEGKATIKATVQKATNGGGYSDYSSSVARSFEAIKSDTKLVYSLDAIGSLYAAQDKLAVHGYNVTAGASQFDKKIAVIAKDEAGNKVKLPMNYVQSISSSDPAVLAVAPVITNTSNVVTAQDGYVIGNKAGTATVSTIVYTNKGETVNLTQEVTVKADTIVVDKIEADKTDRAFDVAKDFAYKYFDNADKGLRVTDQYGIQYKNAEIYANDAVLGLRYTVKVTSGTGVVGLNSATGEITSVPSTVNEFLITAIAPNGKSISVLVSK